jgi:tetratricopeptide (TPR) repeat protein
MSQIFRLTFLFTLCAFLAGCTQSPVGWWKSVNKKAAHLAKVEAQHEALLKQHAALERNYYRLEAELAELKGEAANKDLASLNLAATGSVTGRGPSSISYQIPAGLKPEELQSLAYEHLREKRFAEAAVCFEQLLTLPEAVSLHDANSMYSAGVAWFQLGNYKKARDHFDSSKAQAAGEEKEKIRKKVELWMRVIDRKVANDGQEEKLVSAVVEESPAEPASRAPASHAPEAHAPESHAPAKAHHEPALATPVAPGGHDHGH